MVDLILEILKKVIINNNNSRNLFTKEIIVFQIQYS